MTVPIVGPDGAALAPTPTVGRWYFGMHADGSTGALMQWDGFAFASSLCEDHDVSGYARLMEQPPRG